MGAVGVREQDMFDSADRLPDALQFIADKPSVGPVERINQKQPVAGAVGGATDDAGWPR